jgi:hypothetical protein
VSLKVLPPHVRAHLYLFWAGMALAGLGVLGFFISFWQVGSASAATVDVHYDVPVFAYASIAAWVLGLGIMWYSRRQVDRAVAAKLKADREAMYVEFGVNETDESAPDGREA